MVGDRADGQWVVIHVLETYKIKLICFEYHGFPMLVPQPGLPVGFLQFIQDIGSSTPREDRFYQRSWHQDRCTKILVPKKKKRRA